MGHDGYVQFLCKNGHLWNEDNDTWWPPDVKCQVCGLPPVWENDVDQTNGDDRGHVNMEDFKVLPEKRETCNLGHEHVTSPPIYRVPSEEETTFARTRLNGGRRIRIVLDDIQNS